MSLRTLLLRIGKRAAAGYALELCVNDGAVGWQDRALASEVIPLDLATPGVAEHDGQPMTAKRALELLATTRTKTPDVLAAIGAWLGALLQRGAVAKEWHKLRAQTGPKRPDQLRSFLEVLDDDLDALPWELMLVDGGQAFTDPAAPFARVRAPLEAAPATCTWPLRLLVVVGCRDDEKEVLVADELHAIGKVMRAAGHGLDLLELVQPGHDELVKTLESFQPDIVHFIGHGEEAGGGQLRIFNRGKNSSWAWTAAEVRADLKKATPHLVVLNACHSDGRAQISALGGMAEGLLKVGVVAVVTMQGAIQAQSAVLFAGALYDALLRHDPVNVAVAAARDAVRVKVSFDQRDWALAVLRLGAQPEQVLGDHCLPMPARSQLLAAPEFHEVRDFVARVGERRQLWRDQPATVARASVLLIDGITNVGKTWLARIVLKALAVRGAAVYYRNFDHKGWDLESLLRDLANGVGTSASLVTQPLPDPERTAFHQELATIGDAEERVSRAFAAFLKLLRKLAQTRPLVLAIDDLAAHSDLAKFVRPLLLQPIARGDVPGVRVLMSLRPEVVASLGGIAGDAGVARVELGPFSRTDFPPVAREFLLYYFEDKDRSAGKVLGDYRVEVNQAVVMLEKWAKDGWTPDKLRKLKDLLP